MAHFSFNCCTWCYVIDIIGLFGCIYRYKRVHQCTLLYLICCYSVFVFNGLVPGTCFK